MPPLEAESIICSQRQKSPSITTTLATDAYFKRGISFSTQQMALVSSYVVRPSAARWRCFIFRSGHRFCWLFCKRRKKRNGKKNRKKYELFLRSSYALFDDNLITLYRSMKWRLLHLARWVPMRSWLFWPSASHTLKWRVLLRLK